MIAADDLLVCSTCGTQFDVPAARPLRNCRVCDVSIGTSPPASTELLIVAVADNAIQDPRQFVPPDGQQWTSLRGMKEGNYKNKWTQDSVDKRVWYVQTEPKVSSLVGRLGLDFDQLLRDALVCYWAESIPTSDGTRQCLVGLHHASGRRDSGVCEL